MCQQWFSLAGLVLEVVGFLFVAWEWRHVFKHTMCYCGNNAVKRDYILTKGDVGS
jgi:hypothetical protein